MLYKSVQLEPSFPSPTDRKEGRHDEPDSRFRNFVNLPKNHSVFL
jgi:hypothetical protein